LGLSWPMITNNMPFLLLWAKLARAARTAQAPREVSGTVHLGEIAP
jgi:hypothetical protein